MEQSKHRRPIRLLMALTFGMALLRTLAQTDGVARMSVGINDYNGSGTKHWTLVWVTTESGTFIKTLRKQGTKYGFTSSEWTKHCPQWNLARGGSSGSTLVDGYTSATASNYTGTNSPVVVSWNCRDASNALVPDGQYRFWVQYAEDSSSPGPYTAGGLLWTKGPTEAETTFPDQSANFTNMRVTWTPNTPAPIAPTITSAQPTPSGTVGVPYSFSCAATGTAPITFSAVGLPAGLSLSEAGLISGIPTAGGTFDGVITAANSTAPNASQTFSIVVSVVPTRIVGVGLNAGSIILSGSGPANGRYTILTAPKANLVQPQWSVIASGEFDGQGGFSFIHPVDTALPGLFYSLRVP